MKILDRITLTLFSTIILIIAAITFLLFLGIIDYTAINMMYSDIIASKVLTNILIGISAICALLAIRAIFFTPSNKSENEEGILLENEAGKLLISKDTIENLVNGVAKGFENTEKVSTKVIVDYTNQVKVSVTLMVKPNTVINQLSMNLQTRIKEVVKNVTDLDVKAIDIKIKNIATPEEKKID